MGEMFPWLTEAKPQLDEEEIDLDRDEMIFHSITSQLAAKTH